MTQSSRRAQRSIRRHVVAGVAVLVLLLGALGGWAATTELSGAVVSSGVLVVDSNVKKVQHQTGGTVSELRVRDGSRVQAGDVVVRLDETVTRANLAIVVKSLDELAARQARLEAERDGMEGISFSDQLIRRADDPDVERVISGERKLFAFRRTAREGQKAQLTERIAQLKEEIQAHTGQAKAKAREVELIKVELEAARELYRKNLISIQRMTQLERDAVKIEAERHVHLASAAQTKGKMTETELQIIQIDQELRSEVSKELREIQGKTAEFVERKVAAEDQLKRVDIRAPQDGFVHQLAMHTVGGVVTPGEPIMLIVPEQDELIVEARITPQDIDQLRIGQNAVLRFATFNQRTTPEINARVTRISADTAQDQKSGLTYYVIRLTMAAAEVARLGDLKLIPGMPVEVFMQTDQRTVLSYLIKPLQDQIAKAFRER